MEQDLEQQIKERFAKLPPAVQQAIQSADFEGKLQAIGTKNGLHIDQVGDLQDETLLVMMGMSDPGEFAKRIEERLHLPSPKASEISGEISNEVFMPIRTSMQEFMEEEEHASSAEVVKNALAASAAAQPKPKPDFSVAEGMLQAKTISTPATKQEPPKPANYSADPYREPPL